MNTNYSRQLNMQRNVILVLVMLLVITITTTVTLAAYTRIQSAKTTITLSDPVNVYITVDEEVWQSTESEQIAEEYTNIYPGTRINLKLGFQLGLPDKNSSSAYIRVKVGVISDAELEDEEQLINEDLIVYRDGIKPENWVKVDFGYWDNNASPSQDIWYLYINRTEVSTPVEPTEDEPNPSPIISYEYASRIAQNGHQAEFIDGNIIVSEELDNRFANKKIEILYVVSAIQSVNVLDPIKDNLFYEDAETGEKIYVGRWGASANNNQ